MTSDPVLVLAHSIGGGQRQWDGVARALGGRFRVLRHSFPGHDGRPAPDGPCSLATLGAGVLDLLDEHSVGAAVFCGLSLGGMTGLWLAAHAPDRIRSLVVCCAAIDPMPSRQAWLDRVALVRAAGMAAIADQMPPRWFTPEFIAARPDVVRDVVGTLLATDPAGYAACGEAIAGMDLRASLGLVGAPALIIAGDADQAAPPWLAAVCARGIRDSRLRVLRGVSHLAPVQAPAQISAELARWLDVS